MARTHRFSRVSAGATLAAFAFLAAVPSAQAVDVNETVYSTLLRIHGDTNLDRIEDDDRFRFRSLVGADHDRSNENTNGRASGHVHATVSGGNGEAINGQVELRSTGQWEDVAGGFDESRAEYAISFFAPTAVEIQLSGLLEASQTSRTEIFIDAFDDGRYWEPFSINDDPPFTSRTIRPGDPPDSKTIDETIVLDALTTSEGIYRVYFLTFGDPFNELPQDALLDVSFSIRAIPEPGTALLLGFGMVGLASLRPRTRGAP